MGVYESEKLEIQIRIREIRNSNSIFQQNSNLRISKNKKNKNKIQNQYQANRDLLDERNCSELRGWEGAAIWRVSRQWSMVEAKDRSWRLVNGLPRER